MQHCACLATALGVLLAALAAPAQPRDEVERWVPSFAFSSGVFAFTADASLRSGTFTNRLGQIELLRPAAEDDDLVTMAFVNGSVELMTPGLLALPGKPRLFAHAGGGGAFGSERDIAKEGSPEPFDGDRLVLPTPNQPEEAITGQGSTTTVEADPFDIAAGAGVAFSLDVGGRRLRIKPSVEYFRTSVEVSGVVQRAIRSTVATNVPTEFVLARLTADESKVHQGVGGGLEIEVDAARAGPLLLSMFLGGQVVRVLGDRDVKLSATSQIDDPILGQQTLDASWEYEASPWIYRGGVGMRFRWLPE